jgi:hypothetical protein
MFFCPKIEIDFAGITNNIFIINFFDHHGPENFFKSEAPAKFINDDFGERQGEIDEKEKNIKPKIEWEGINYLNPANV